MLGTPSSSWTIQPTFLFRRSKVAVSRLGVMQANGNATAAASSRAEDAVSQGAAGVHRPPQSAPLALVVTDAVRRWYADAHREAHKGDIKQQALLAEMMREGYGCERDPAGGQDWADKARRRGYRMSGVYCEL